MLIFGIIVFFVIVGIIYLIYFKRIRLRNFSFIDGTLGSGKSFLMVGLGIKTYRAQLRQWWVKNLFRKIFRKPPLEKPLLYSNMKLRNIEFVLVTKEMLLRKNFRFAYKSVLLLDDTSLVIDQMSFKDKVVNEQITEFIKLFRHETQGGYLLTNSQSIADLHYSFKYSISDYIYIHSRTSILRLFSILRLEERAYSADNSSVQTKTEDIEKDLKLFCLLNKYYKYYDTYCYSVFTDMLPVNDKKLLITKKENLKSEELVSFKEYNYLYDNLNLYKEKEKEKNV